MGNFFLYIKESYNELVHNVTWPTWSELIAAARLVIIASIIFALLVYVMDLASSNILKAIYEINKPA